MGHQRLCSKGLKLGCFDFVQRVMWTPLNDFICLCLHFNICFLLSPLLNTRQLLLLTSALYQNCRPSTRLSPIIQSPQPNCRKQADKARSESEENKRWIARHFIPRFSEDGKAIAPQSSSLYSSRVMEVSHRHPWLYITTKRLWRSRSL